ncbi:DUF3040 domain-containing protein [Millisia brevis]|uniref:DUF3040 domain-containing protein n=1 Tax=Millisia brevis TaxID=264148 RepID=UPI000835D5E3|nr:DUF3040 domain-containing protein [Millisia brevis]
MPLSEHEQRMLDQIERDLYAQDPKFASAVRRGGGGGIRSAQGPRKLQAIALFVVGLVLLVAGIPLSTQSQLFLLVSLLGFLLMFGAGVLILLGGKGRSAGTAGEAGSTERAAAPKKRPSGKSFTARMEDRFRKRFE